MDNNYLTSDLDIVNYRGKWKDARRLASLRLGAKKTGEYWRLVRITFLELGGQFR